MQTSPDVYKRMGYLSVIIGSDDSDWSPDDPSEPPYDPRFDVRKAMAEIEKGSLFRKSPGWYSSAQRDRETWLFKFLVNALREGPVPLRVIFQMATDANRGDVKALRIASKTLGVEVGEQSGEEVWSIPRSQ